MSWLAVVVVRVCRRWTPARTDALWKRHGPWSLVCLKRPSCTTVACRENRTGVRCADTDGALWGTEHRLVKCVVHAWLLTIPGTHHQLYSRRPLPRATGSPHLFHLSDVSLHLPPANYERRLSSLICIRLDTPSMELTRRDQKKSSDRPRVGELRLDAW